MYLLTDMEQIACHILALFKNNLGGIMIDFIIPEETKAVRDKVRALFKTNATRRRDRTADNFDETGGLAQGGAQGFGVRSFLQHGGMGLRPLANALAGTGGKLSGCVIAKYAGSR